MTAAATAIAPGEVLRAVAVEVGACIRPVLQRLIDTSTGDTRVVPIPCGATLATSCPSCAERNRRLRMQQCREGWHLADDPLDHADPDAAADLDDDPTDDDHEQLGGECGRRVRSTRRRQDVPDLPRLPVEDRTVGRAFTSRDGKVWHPSTFLTVTMPSYGPVLEDGTPVDPGSYDYRRAALDALHAAKLWDRLIQNLRRAAGYRLQYFAVVEPQRRLAPHLHAAIRGAIPRRLLRQVIAATYEQIWWPRFDHPVYPDPNCSPIWRQDADGTGRYVDPATGTPMPTWDDALDAIDSDPDASPAYVARFGRQHDIQGLIAGPKTDRRIGYLTKYLTKSMTQGAGDDLTDRQRAHADRLHAEVRWLPCSPQCANWLRYGITPADPHPGMQPGHCPKRAHRPDRLGCGGRRVLVSRLWTGKTLTDHAADRRDAVRTVLAAAGIDLPAGCSATDTRPDGQPRWRWEPLSRNDPEGPSYQQVIMKLIRQRFTWREQYQHARDGSAPLGELTNSATSYARTGT